MAKRRIEVIPGARYEALKVIKEAESIKPNKHKVRMVLCACDCGNEATVRLDYLRRGHTKSCGCRRKVMASITKGTHRMSGTRIHRIWTGMKKRCYNPNSKSHKDYGEKGVIVCDEWHEFTPFNDWALSNGYEEHLTIERLNPYGNYEPSNCTWIPKSEQGKNKRKKVLQND